ncbi:MAG: hypothetical protein ACLRIS_01805 [Flavonifractor plautii]
MIFRPAKSVTDGDPDGRVLLALAEHGSPPSAPIPTWTRWRGRQ